MFNARKIEVNGQTVDQIITNYCTANEETLRSAISVLESRVSEINNLKLYSKLVRKNFLELTQEKKDAKRFIDFLKIEVALRGYVNSTNAMSVV